MPDESLICFYKSPNFEIQHPSWSITDILVGEVARIIRKLGIDLITEEKS